MKTILIIVLLLTSYFSFSQDDFNTLMMKSTFKLSGEGTDKNTNVFGTGFLIGVPVPNQSNRVFIVLITAKHVFDDMKGDSITLYARNKINDNYETLPLKIRIRQGKNNLYVSHSTQDVAAINIGMPNNSDFDCVPFKFLADDSTLI